MQPMSPAMLAALAGANASSQDEQLAPVPPVPQAQEPQQPGALGGLGNLGGLALLAASGNPMFQQFAAQMMMAQGEDQRRAQAQKDYQNFQLAQQARAETVGANEAAKQRNFSRQMTREDRQAQAQAGEADAANRARIRAEDLAREDKRYAESVRFRNAELGANLEAQRYGRLRDATNDTIRMIQGFQGGNVDPMEVYKLVQMDPNFIGIKDPKKKAEYLTQQVAAFQQMGGKPDARMLDNLINSQAALVDEKDREQFLQRVKLMAPMEAPSTPTAIKDFSPAIQTAIKGVQSLIVKPAIEHREMTPAEQAAAHAQFSQLATSPEGRRYFDETVAPAIKQTFATQFEIAPEATDRLLRQMAAEAADASQSQLELSVPTPYGSLTIVPGSTVVGPALRKVAGSYTREGANAAIQRSKDKAAARVAEQERKRAEMAKRIRDTRAADSTRTAQRWEAARNEPRGGLR